MKRFLITIFIFFIVSGSLFAQTPYQIREAIDFFNSNKLQRGEQRGMLTADDIEGSPYLNDKFIEGAVFTTSKTKYVGVPLRYNIYNDQIEFKSGENQVQALAAPEVIEKVEFGDYTMVYIPFVITKKIRRGFFVEMEKGEKAALYARPRIVFEKATKPAAYQEAEPAKFDRKSDEYYIRIGMEPAQLISRRKDLEEVFPNHKKEVKSFIKENRVRPNKPERIEKLVEFYNSL